MESNFGTSTPYSLGIEEEFQLVDLETLELTPRVEAVLAAFEGQAVSDRVMPELLQSVVEVATRIAVDVEEAIDDLADLRFRLGRAAAEHGAAIASAGTHPFSRSDEQLVTDRPRYRGLSEGLGWLASRQPVFGLHVHVGVGSAAKAAACADGVRDRLPELLALSANSPLRHGEPTGLASTRAQIVLDLPRSGLPPALGSFGAFEAEIERGAAAGVFPDYTHVWWDVRPHPRLGTVEVRVFDAQTRLSSVAAIAALTQSLVATIGSEFECGDVATPAPVVVLEENRRRAARNGLEALLVDPSDGTERTAAETLRALVERCAPAADALGCAAQLQLVESILRDGTGADEQLRVHAETHDARAVARRLVAETAALAAA